MIARRAARRHIVLGRHVRATVIKTGRACFGCPRRAIGTLIAADRVEPACALHADEFAEVA